MAHWYYKGMTTAPIDHPTRGPVALKPRERFEAPKAAVQHLINAGLVSRLPDPPKKKSPEGATEAPVTAEAPSPSSGEAVKTGGSKSEEATKEEFAGSGDTTISPLWPTNVVASSPTTTTEEAGEGVAEDTVKESSESKEEESSGSSRKKGRRRRGSRSENSDG